ncbi:Clp protease N-terminal domain-containing protein [Catelliglobosispora koreensis]|uniref:Clp protease N-terminal domain-containing protein n=1 Tax=Catelliglobosispora koreensis TaxID=129052 RepID=UPI00035DB705|nr:Clp protease N-terminal domain-containing protein [Catelliglobosispora koreensis]
MLHNFTEEARQALIQGQVAARELRFDTLDSAAMLLGLLTAEKDPAVKALVQQGITPQRVREQVTRQRPPAFAETQKRAVAYSAEAQEVLEQAVWESKRLGHKRIITAGHLILAMIRVQHSAAAFALAEIGADFSAIEMAVAAQHVPSQPDAAVELSAEFRQLLVEASGWDWPRPRRHFAGYIVSALWYAATLALMVELTRNTSGPELVLALAAVFLVVRMALYAWRFSRARIPAPESSTVLFTPPQLRELLASWGVSDFALWLRDDYKLDDHAVRIGTKARIGVSREVFNRPAESGEVVAHELAHVLRNDSSHGTFRIWALYSLAVPAFVTFEPSVWVLAAVSLVAHHVMVSWRAEIACDLIGVRLTSYQQMVSFFDRAGGPRYRPARTHPPVALRLWIVRRFGIGIPRTGTQDA